MPIGARRTSDNRVKRFHIDFHDSCRANLLNIPKRIDREIKEDSRVHIRYVKTTLIKVTNFGGRIGSYRFHRHRRDEQTDYSYFLDRHTLSQ